MRHAPLLVLALAIGSSGCGNRYGALTRAQLATVQRAVETCTAATGRLVPHLKANDRTGARNAAIDARNSCSQARADIAAAIGTGTPLDACTFAIDRQEAAERAELANLDYPSLANGQTVVARLDEAIRQQTACSAAIDTAGDSDARQAPHDAP